MEPNRKFTTEEYEVNLVDFCEKLGLPLPEGKTDYLSYGVNLAGKKLILNSAGDVDKEGAYDPDAAVLDTLVGDRTHVRFVVSVQRHERRR
jgi:hypothetical protein